jgi:hypothetical protein
MVSYCMNQPSIKQRQLKEFSELLLAIQLLEAQINFNTKIIASMEANFSPMLIDGFQTEAALKRSENLELQNQLFRLKFKLSMYLAANKYK